MGGWGEKNEDDFKIASSGEDAAETLGAQSRSLRKSDGTKVSQSEPSVARPPSRPAPPVDEIDEAVTQQSPTKELTAAEGVVRL